MSRTLETVTGPVPLVEPREGLPAVVDTPGILEATVAVLAAGSGPIGVDAERASGYRYGQRAFLVQLRRAGAGTALIDPVACPDLSALDAALDGAESVLHAADQDLPCLAELGFRPRRIFDTERAGRLLGYPKVGLASLVRTVLGLELEKGHAAVDWSRRPVPEAWLRYAALDVEVLVELRDALEEELRGSGKLAWAREEFAAIAAAPPPAPRPDPWRRTSGIHRVRSRRGLAVVRALWEARDRIARHRDLAPGRVLPDSAIVEAGRAPPRSAEELRQLKSFDTKMARRHLQTWFGTIQGALRLPDTSLPERSSRQSGLPPASRWSEFHPAAAERLAAARATVAGLADTHGVSVESLLSPSTLRQLVWAPPETISAESLAVELREQGARDWQVGLLADALAAALNDPASVAGSETGPDTEGETDPDTGGKAGHDGGRVSRSKDGSRTGYPGGQRR